MGIPPTLEPKMSKLEYPETRREDISDVLHGVRVEDPYRWLEEDTKEVLAWQARQDSYADAVLGAWPDQERLREAVRSALLEGASEAAATPSFHGEFAFQMGPRPGAQQPVLWVTEGVGGTPRVLVDVNEMAEGSTLDWFYPSSGGDYVAYGVSQHGDEQSVLRVVETRTGRVLPARIPHTSFARIAWLPDSSGFFYSGGKASDFEDSQKWLFFHSLEDTVVQKPDPKRFHHWYIAPQLSPDGRYLLVIVGEENPRASWFRDLQADEGWRPVMPDKSGDAYGEFEGARYLALTTYGASRGRIISIPMASADDEGTWSEVVAESDAVLRDFVVVDGHLVISELHHAHSRLRRVALDGSGEEIVSLPGMGLIRGAQYPGQRHLAVRDCQVYFGYTTFTEPLRLYAYDLDSRSLMPQGAGPEVDLSHLDVRQVAFASRDGTRVTMFLVHRRDLDLSQSHPTLLHGYGGWNIAPAPGYVGGTLAGAYVRCVLPFIEAGAIYVFVNLRGGPEYGRDWWQAGRLKAKQNTYDDLYAAAEHLIATRLTTHALLATMGASNGGLLAAVAVTQRPDLFRAVVSQVPISDMMRSMNDPYTASCLVEYGDPAAPEMFTILLGYSPVHNVREGVAYPATLIQCGASDVRCPPWNGRKLAALLQAATTSEHPILLKVHKGAGHGAGLSLDGMVERDATCLGFIMQQLGIKVAGEA
jgi:prolyl oligopeptidase